MPNCEKCLNKARIATAGLGVVLSAPMFQDAKEKVFEDKLNTYYKFTFKCPSCDTIKIVFGYECGICGGSGYHCHVHHATTCNPCHGTGIYEVPESYIEWLKTGKQPTECDKS